LNAGRKKQTPGAGRTVPSPADSINDPEVVARLRDLAAEYERRAAATDPKADQK